MNTKTASHNFTFVCYNPCHGGEKLSVEVSKILGKNLSFYMDVGNRTVIMDDFFDKIFLKTELNWDTIINDANTILSNKPLSDNIVVPSHFDYDYLLPHFPNSKFIRILSPTNNQEITKVLNDTYNKIWTAQFRNFKEFVGYCLCWISNDKLKTLLAEKKLLPTMTHGEIQCIIRNIIPSEENLKKTFIQYASNQITNLSIVNHPQILNIPYNSYENLTNKIKDFVNQTD